MQARLDRAPPAERLALYGDAVADAVVARVGEGWIRPVAQGGALQFTVRIDAPCSALADAVGTALATRTVVRGDVPHSFVVVDDRGVAGGRLDDALATQPVHTSIAAATTSLPHTLSLFLDGTTATLVAVPLVEQDGQWTVDGGPVARALDVPRVREACVEPLRVVKARRSARVCGEDPARAERRARTELEREGALANDVECTAEPEVASGCRRVRCDWLP